MHYLFHTFLRQASSTQVIEYLARRDIAIEVPKDKRKAKTAAWLFEGLRGRLHEEHIDFAEIQLLANEAGAQLLLAEADRAGLQIAEPLAAQEGFLSKSFWAFLNHRPVFDSALRRSVTDHLPGRYWKRRLPLPGKSSTDYAARREVLKQEISAYFLDRDARGQACDVVYVDQSPQHRFFAYPEDYSTRPIVWNGPTLEAQTIRPAFELVFVYDADLQSLDVYARGGNHVAEAMWRVFAHAVFGLDDLPAVPVRNLSLDRLKARTFVFKRSVESPIVDVQIRKLRLAVTGVETLRLSVEVDSTAALHRALDRLFPVNIGRQGYDLSAARVIGATIVATIDQRDGRGSRKRSFDISPRTCALRYDGTDGLLRQMLCDSGIDPTS